MKHSFIDKSNKVGFRFVFYCERCGKKHLSRFIRFTGYNTDSLLKKLTQIIYRLLTNIKKGSEESFDNDRKPTLSHKMNLMSTEWTKQHEFIFKNSLSQVMLSSFNRCQGCMKYICDYCYVVEKDKCVECSIYDESSSNVIKKSI